MDRSDPKTTAIVKRVQNARRNLLVKQPFYGMLLMHMRFALDKSCETSYTDGVRIGFNPVFFDTLSNRELELLLMHEVLHTALGHPFRMQADYDLEIFDQACDIVVNSNLLYSFGMDTSKITLKSRGILPHLTPNGEEGYKFTLEQVYAQLMKAAGKPQKKQNQNKNGSGGKAIAVRSGDSDEKEADSRAGEKSDAGNGKGEKPSLTDLIASLKAKNAAIAASLQKDDALEEPTADSTPQNASIDDHSFWEGDDEIGSGAAEWTEHMIGAAEAALSSAGGKGRGTVPLAAKRAIDEIKNPILDWRTVLDTFVQEEICDYSFAPPDKRMDDCPFFLPDFNEKDESVKNILFMIDTSGSMSDDAITQCYSEIYGAIGQFGGKLAGKLGFFDAVVVEPVPFEDEDEFKIIRPKGGGGTSFDIIFEYVQKHMRDEPPVSIVILTDGYAPFPDEEEAGDIPVLWIINNNDVTPPWGKIARMIQE